MCPTREALRAPVGTIMREDPGIETRDNELLSPFSCFALSPSSSHLCQLSLSLSTWEVREEGMGKRCQAAIMPSMRRHIIVQRLSGPPSRAPTNFFPVAEIVL